MNIEPKTLASDLTTSGATLGSVHSLRLRAIKLWPRRCGPGSGSVLQPPGTCDLPKSQAGFVARLCGELHGSIPLQFSHPQYSLNNSWLGAEPRHETTETLSQDGYLS